MPLIETTMEASSGGALQTSSSSVDRDSNVDTTVLIRNLMPHTVGDLLAQVEPTVERLRDHEHRKICMYRVFSNVSTFEHA